MAILLGKYDQEFFKSIPHLHDATGVFLKKKVKDYIDQLGEVFHKHGVNKEYGLIMVHRHFDMEQDEILVETLKKDHSVSVSIPWIMKGDIAVPKDGKILDTHGIKMDSSMAHIIPQTWSFTENGELKAYEFLAAKEVVEPPPYEFTVDLYHRLKQLGLEKILGVRYVDNLINRVSWEVTPDGGRANVLTFGPLPEHFDKTKMFQVVYMFNMDEGNGYCCCYSDSHSWSSCSSDNCRY